MFFKKSKKGQFYIFIAVIFCSLALGLILGNFSTRGYKVVFDNLKNNFITESTYVVNSAIFQEEDPDAQFYDFLLFYQNYSRTKNVDFRLLYFLVEEDTLHINNRLDFSINVSTPEESILVNPSSRTEIDKPESVEVMVDDSTTEIDFNNDSTQLKMYFKIGLIK